jgi:hypothetical protein
MYPRFVYAYLWRNLPRRNHPNHPRGKQKNSLSIFPLARRKKKSPKTSKKSMMVRIYLEKLRSVTPVKKTLADLKMGLAQKKMERAMRGHIGSSRTSDTGGFTMGNVIPCTPLAASTPKHRCSQCWAEFNMKSSLDHHLKSVH